MKISEKLKKLFKFSLNADPKLARYVESIDRFNSSQTNREMLDAIRAYNHTIISSLNAICPLRGLKILDVGASPHGYALEKSLALGASEYIGIGLDINETFVIETAKSCAQLLWMDAEKLSFSEGQFDAIVTMSTFEHIGNLNQALSEFKRVLKPGGFALITFEPIWTSSYGHHLHHLGDVSKVVPDWAHLLLTKAEMLQCLEPIWPNTAEISLQEAVEWIYQSTALNRKGIREIKESITSSGMYVEWIIPMHDICRNETQLTAAMLRTGLSSDELMTKGLSVLLCKK